MDTASKDLFQKSNKLGAYFTVEATLVLPIVLGVFVLILYLMFFQYNRCLLEQDMGMLALRGTSLQENSYEDRYQQIKNWSETMYWEKYVAWEKGDTTIKIGSGMVEVGGEGRLKFPFKGLAFGDGERLWEMKTIYRNEMLSPVSVLRKYRRLKEGV